MFNERITADENSQVRDLLEICTSAKELLKTEELSNPNWMLSLKQGKELLNPLLERENLVGKV